MKYQSNALWPDDTDQSLGGMYGDYISTDVHDSFDMALGVCQGLKREGYGGERKIFPLITWVSPVQTPAVLPTDDSRKQIQAFIRNNYPRGLCLGQEARIRYHMAKSEAIL